MRHLAVRDSVLIAFQMVTDGGRLEDVMLMTTPCLQLLLLILRFIITVLIITGFAKISTKFINFGTEAILPSEIELTASIESAIGVG